MARTISFGLSRHEAGTTYRMGAAFGDRLLGARVDQGGGPLGP